MERRLTSGRVGEACFDVLTAAMSCADIVLDIAVCAEFFRDGRWEFFWTSLTIFLIAQAAYAFLFVATYGADLRPRHSFLAFLAVLPAAQLVPIFTLAERSCNSERVSAALRSVGLEPTSKDDPPTEDTDSLWTLVQRKYHAHAGFLVEALVEAIPQGALQITAVCLARESSVLNIFSILLSLAVIGSKGWLAAYSLHRPTFVFNSLCIAADVACCFACASWLAITYFDADYVEVHAHPAAATLSRLLVSALGAATVCGVVGGGGVVAFTILDDHLKTRDSNPSTGITLKSVFFELYVVRSAAWLISLLPCVTLLVLLRLSLLPLLAFRSLSSEHATHHAFFEALFAFLRGQHVSEAATPRATVRTSTLVPPPFDIGVVVSGAAGAAAPDAAQPAQPVASPLVKPSAVPLEERLSVANTVIALAFQEQSDLRARLSTLSSSAREQRRQRDSVVRAWAAALGRPHLAAWRANADGSATSDVMVQAEVRTLLPPDELIARWQADATEARAPPTAVGQMSRWQRRLALVRHSVRRRRAEWKAELALRSEVFRRIFSDRWGGSGSSRRSETATRGVCRGLPERIIVALAILSLSVAVLAALPAAVLVAVLVPLSAAYPLVQLSLSLSLSQTIMNDEAGSGPAAATVDDPHALVLPWVLSATFAALVLALFVLLPVVHRFQLLRADLLSTSGL